MFQLLSGAWACQFLLVHLFLLHEVCLVPTCVVGPSYSVKNGFAIDIFLGYELRLGVGTCEERRWVIWGIAGNVVGIVKEVFHDAHAILVQFPVHLCINKIFHASVTTLMRHLVGQMGTDVPYAVHCA